MDRYISNLYDCSLSDNDKSPLDVCEILVDKCKAVGCINLDNYVEEYFKENGISYPSKSGQVNTPKICSVDSLVITSKLNMFEFKHKTCKPIEIRLKIKDSLTFLNKNQQDIINLPKEVYIVYQKENEQLSNINKSKDSINRLSTKKSQTSRPSRRVMELYGQLFQMHLDIERDKINIFNTEIQEDQIELRKKMKSFL